MSEGDGRPDEAPPPGETPPEAGGDGGDGGDGGERANAAPRRRLLPGVPRPLLVVGAASIVFVVVASVVAFGYGNTGSSTKPLTQSQIKALLQHNTSGPSVGFTRVNRPAPTFTLPPVVGTKPVDLARLTGKPLVVNFWYSTCPPCKKEAPALAAVAKATAGKVTFVGVDYEDSRSSAAAFMRRHGETYPDGFDASGKVATQVFGIVGTPTTFFLSPNGKRELGVQTGAMTEAQLVHDLHALYGVKA